MAGEPRNTLQELVGVLRDILEPIALATGDETARGELLRTLGLDPGAATPALSIPPSALAGVDQYRAQRAGEADLQAFLDAFADLTQIVQALVDLIKTALAAQPGGPPAGLVAEEMATTLLSQLTTGYLRARHPGVYIVAHLLQLIEEESLRFANVRDLFFRSGQYIEKFGGSIDDLDHEADAERVSDVILLVVGAVLSARLKAEFVYGYDAGPGSSSPLADAISDRTLMLQFKGSTEDAQGRKGTGTLLLGAVLVPKDHGGETTLIRLQSLAAINIPLTPNLSITLSLETPDIFFDFGIGLTGLPPMTEASGSLRLEYASTGPTVVRLADGAKDAVKAGTVEVWTVTAIPDNFGVVDDGRTLSLVDPGNATETIAITAIDVAAKQFTVTRGADGTTPVTHTADARYNRSRTIVIGDPNGINLRLGKLGLEAGLSVADSVADYSVKADIKNSTFVLGTDKDADNFLHTVLSAITPNGKLETKFDFEIGYSRKRGPFIGGGAGFQLAIPLHETLGPLRFDTLSLGLAVGDRAGKEPGVKVEGALSFGLDLSVLKVSVDRIGLSGLWTSDGFTLGFKPPTGAGLAIASGPVNGGGFVSFDPDRGEYAGGLELNILDKISLVAMGLITTRLPDGSDGFSILIIVSAEKIPPIQVGMGFVLLGLGLIAGLNRAMRLEAIAAGAKSGSLESVLFPKNIVANAARIISDLRTFFPPQRNTFVIGAMAKMGWGTPALITLSLGVVVQIPPFNIGILGVLKVSAPDEEAAVLKLKVAFVGALEFDKQRAWFFATLYESRLLTFTIEGGLGVLVSWGEGPNLVISVGGFHPQFQPPPLPFPVPDRLAISIINEPQARLRFTAYFAITPNTVQFGAAIELYVGFSGLEVEGHLSIDCLFQFVPFHFTVEISASISLKVFGAGLFSVRLRGTLEGTSPWHLTGTASVSFLFFSVSADVDITRGLTLAEVLADVLLMPLLAAELALTANWTAELPPGSALSVSLRSLESEAAAAAGPVLHPLGQLRISQRLAPLDLTVDKLGNRPISDTHKVSLSVAGGALLPRGPASEMFPIAQFQNLADSAKLSSPAFQPEPGGLVLAAAGDQWRSSRLVKRRIRFEVVIVDTGFKRFRSPLFAFWKSLFEHFTKGNAVAVAEFSARGQHERQPFTEKVGLRPGGYAVVGVDDNRPLDATAARFDSEAQARDHLRSLIAADRRLAGVAHVLPSSEVNPA